MPGASVPSNPRGLRRPGKLACAWLAAAACACGGASAAPASLTVSAVVPSKNVCKFNTNVLVLDFGTLNQLSTVDAVASVTASLVCNGSAPLATFSVSADDGLHASSPGFRRMRNKTALTQFMGYSLAISPSSGTVQKAKDFFVTFTGTIAPYQFQNVAAGDYEDRVVVTVAP